MEYRKTSGQARQKTLRIRVTAVLAITSASTLVASGGTALLQIQKAPAVLGPWQDLSAGVLSLTPEGGFADTIQSNSYYRLHITTTNSFGIPLAIPVESADKAAANEAAVTLSRNMVGWPDNAVLAPYAYPVYDPSINSGTTPAYLEFKVIPGRSNGTNQPTPFTPGEPISDLGYILVSLTTNDVPVPEMARGGLTRVEKLRRKAQSSNIKAVRYGQGFLVGEDSAGKPMAALGSLPPRLPLEVLTFRLATLGGEVVSNVVVSDTGQLATNSAYVSYADFKQDYVGGPVFSFMHARRSEAGLFRWNLESGIAPPVVVIPLGKPTPILTNLQISGFDLDDPSVATGSVANTLGINMTGLRTGDATLHVYFADSTTAYYGLQAGSISNSATPRGITVSTSIAYAGSCADQVRYDQEAGIHGCPAGYVNGCGPTAWAMLYAWWDHRGVCNLIGPCGEPTPVNVDANVRSCIEAVCIQTGTFGAPFSDQSATFPWNMGAGTGWAASRFSHINARWNYCVPGFGSAPLNRAKAALDAGRVAIVGIGFYSHYPLAFGYGTTTWTFTGPFGLSFSLRGHFWVVNEGWGDDPCSITMEGTDGCFFGIDASCY